MVQTYTLDELDKEMIKLLSKDGRMAFTEIANQLNVSEKTIRVRYKNLVENQILEVVGIVNPISLGVKTGAIIQISVQPNTLDHVIDELRSFREIRYISFVSGEFQLLTQVNVHTYEELTETLKKVNRIAGIMHVNVMVQLEVYKNSFEYL
ncbi:Lrp/AsnC family transcriptional regulator [Tepidibacillus infernus]|uniref:AsnC family transcriptional regulator n=1 Tax=Tepidibacillus decaturensis TaxID=1413211 RepID=A0A135L3L3_9BACI|nr:MULTISPECIES: Lrp/AsnC family transcriptional regulator [Tepidibacillus]KXG43586.1 AsnC family transcriptional regulator [Tepidibacillus decaturensis]GBF12154.1 regulatory protein AsnC [Tepidibacillus sp. HK-1]